MIVQFALRFKAYQFNKLILYGPGYKLWKTKLVKLDQAWIPIFFMPHQIRFLKCKIRANFYHNKVESCPELPM